MKQTTAVFVKMCAAGNDFIMVDARQGPVRDPKAKARLWCARKNSVGADGLILLERSRRADARMRIFNPDGSQAEMCGNGVRCLALFAKDLKIGGRDITVETGAGLIWARVTGSTVKARLVDPHDFKPKVGICVEGKCFTLSTINTGVPHAVCEVADVKSAQVERLGRAIRRHRLFAPKGTNVDFVSFEGGENIEVRTYERGVEGETLACGTGSAASALAAAYHRGLSSPVSVRTRGGQRLKVYFKRNGGDFKDVYLEGKVLKTFEGRIAL